MNNHITLSPKGREAIKKTINWLENQGPDVPAFHMDYGVEALDGDNIYPSDIEGHQLEEGCGTVCCIAGFISALEPETSWNSIRDAAERILVEDSVTRFEESEALGALWHPARQDVDPDTIFPSDAVKVLRYLLETGRVDWWLAEEDQA